MSVAAGHAHEQRVCGACALVLATRGVRLVARWELDGYGLAGSGDSEPWVLVAVGLAVA